MAPIVIVHLLIGIPASGKSTVAEFLHNGLENSLIISTDRIREQLYGDEGIQGQWSEVEAEVLQQVQQAVAAGKTNLIYDATNTRTEWRANIQQKLRLVTPKTQWIGWWLQTPVLDCITRNQSRKRQVPEEIIRSAQNDIELSPPVQKKEGFKSIIELPDSDREAIEDALNQLSRARRNQLNRASRKLHQYSCEGDFNRLMHFMQLLLKYPGAGNLQQTNPALLEQIFGKPATFSTGIEEISALMTLEYGLEYREPAEIIADIDFLENNGILGCQTVDLTSPIQVGSYTGKDLPITHRCSNHDTFQRLMLEVRYILREPMVNEPASSARAKLVEILSQAGIKTTESAIRDDFRKTFHEFHLFPHKSMNQGYYLGTAVFTETELKRIYDMQKAYWHLAQNPHEQAIFKKFEEFEERFLDTTEKLEGYFDSDYPIRVILNGEVYNWEKIGSDCVLRNPTFNINSLEQAIQTGKRLTLTKIPRRGTYPSDPLQKKPFEVWGLQLVFNNIGWYLGFECADGEYEGLYQFERLDRLKIKLSESKEPRHYLHQQQSLKKLVKLYQANGIGIFLGNSVADQQTYLSKNPSSAEIILELWCSDYIYNHLGISTQRFPKDKVKYSPRSGEGAKQFPHKFLITLPKWMENDFDLRRWIFGYGAEVMVIAPHSIKTLIQEHADSISQLYQRKGDKEAK